MTSKKVYVYTLHYRVDRRFYNWSFDTRRLKVKGVSKLAPELCSNPWLMHDFHAIYLQHCFDMIWAVSPAAIRFNQQQQQINNHTPIGAVKHERSFCHGFNQHRKKRFNFITHSSQAANQMEFIRADFWCDKLILQVQIHNTLQNNHTHTHAHLIGIV